MNHPTFIRLELLKSKPIIQLFLLAVCLFLTNGFELYANSKPDSALFADEATSNGAVQDFLKSSKKINVQSRQWQEISLQDAVTKVLAVNFGLAQNSELTRIADQSLIVAESASDPTLSFSVGYSRSKTYDRQESYQKYFSGTVGCDDAPSDEAKAACEADYTGPGGGVDGDGSTPVYRFFGTTIPIAYNRYTKEREAEWTAETMDASESPLTGPSEQENYALSVNKPLPWGASVSMNQSSTRKDTSFYLYSDQDLPDPSFGFYEQPWTSKLSASLDLPLPGSKEYGPLASREVTVRQEKLNLERAKTSYNKGEEALLLSVEEAFWNLVSKVRLLESVSRNHKSLIQLHAKTSQLFEIERVTAYAKAQTDAELARVQGEEWIAWNNYVQASNTLNLLLNYATDTLFLPVGYTEILASDISFDLQKALAASMRQNHQLKIMDVDLQKSDLTLEQRQAQTRPNVSLALSVTSSQKSSVYGYQTYGESVSKLLDPDSIAVSGSLTYRHPWKNRYVQASLKRAKSQRSATDLQKRMAQNQVILKIKNAFATLSSVRSRIAITNRNLMLAQATYEKALELQVSSRRVTEYEIIVKNGARLDAQNLVIQARIDSKKAEAQLRATMGTLKNYYLGESG